MSEKPRALTGEVVVSAAPLLGNRAAPLRPLGFLGHETDKLEHRESPLLFARDRLIYDTRIGHGREHIGEMTLALRTEFERGEGLLGLFRERTLKIVYIENISLREQSSGYASALFRYYEGLIGRLGYHQFRLKASLSVVKYYWVSKGFDRLDESGVARVRARLRALGRSE